MTIFGQTPRFGVLERPELALELIERVGSATDEGVARADWVGTKPARDVAYYAKGQLTGFAPGLDIRAKLTLWVERPGEPPIEFRAPPTPVGKLSADGSFEYMLIDFAMLDWDEDLNDESLQFFCVFTSDAVAPGDLSKVLWPKEGSQVVAFNAGMRTPPATVESVSASRAP